jgi:hypothetical protein
MSTDLNLLNLPLETIAHLQYLYREMEQTIQMAQRASPSPIVPLQAARPTQSIPLNPEAPEFVSSHVVPSVKMVSQRWSRPSARPDAARFEDFLQEGETVYLSLVVGRHPDNYPVFSAAECTYHGGQFTVHTCVDVPSMVGKTSDKPGVLLYDFIDGLVEAKKLAHKVKVTVWKHTGVKRNGKHISLYNLAGLQKEDK